MKLTENQMRDKIRAFIKKDFGSVRAYAKHYGLNDEVCRQALRGDKNLTVAMVATVSDGKIPKIVKKTRRYFIYEN